ncbi:MAG: hypothetical protein WCU88_09845 [Elusimicrobiota bacterium]|jgi:hypothetical protein
MTPGLLLDISLIPAKLAGLMAVTRGIAFTMLAFIIPLTIMQLNVRAMKDEGSPGYNGFFVRTLLTIAALLAYSRLFFFILKSSQLLSFAMLSEQQWGNFLNEGLRTAGTDGSVFSILVRSATSIQAIALFISSLAAVTIRDVLVMVQSCFLSLLFVFGPIALVCGINDKASQVTRGWLANSVQVASWTFFLRLVVRVWLTLNPMAGTSGTGATDDYLGILVVNVSFALMVLGTPIVAARLLSGENLAMMGTVVMSTVNAISLGKAIQTGRFINKEAEKLKRASPAERMSRFHHPISSTMTRAYRALFDKRGAKQEGGGQ